MSRLPIQFLAIPIIALTIFFVWDFSQRVVTNLRIDQAAKEYTIKVAHAQATQTALIAEKARVASPDYAEEVARSKWRWARDGETVVVTQVTPVAPTPVPVPQISIPKPTTTWWQDLVDFLFGP
jgi:cell division protein FtsB